MWDNKTMSATHDALIWARERAAAGVRSNFKKLDEEIRSVKRYPVEGGSGSVWVTERHGESGSEFECSTAPLGCGGHSHPAGSDFISRRVAELAGQHADE